MKVHYKIVVMLRAGIFLIFAVASSGQQGTAPQASPQGAKKAPAATQTQKSSPRRAPLEVPQLKFEKYKLQNGLVVILSEDHRLPMVAVSLGTMWAPPMKRQREPALPISSST